MDQLKIYNVTRYIPDAHERSQQEAAGVFSHARSYQTRLRLVLNGRIVELHKAAYWNKREHAAAVAGDAHIWRWDEVTTK